MYVIFFTSPFYRILRHHSESEDPSSSSTLKGVRRLIYVDFRDLIYVYTYVHICPYCLCTCVCIHLLIFFWECPPLFCPRTWSTLRTQTSFLWPPLKELKRKTEYIMSWSLNLYTYPCLFLWDWFRKRQIGFLTLSLQIVLLKGKNILLIKIFYW